MTNADNGLPDHADRRWTRVVRRVSPNRYPKSARATQKPQENILRKPNAWASFETGDLGARESKVHRARPMSDDLVPHLQQSGSGCVELFSPEVRAVLSVSMSWALTLTWAPLGCTEPSGLARTPESLPIALGSTSPEREGGKARDDEAVADTGNAGYLQHCGRPGCRPRMIPTRPSRCSAGALIDACFGRRPRLQVSPGKARFPAHLRRSRPAAAPQRRFQSVTLSRRQESLRRRLRRLRPGLCRVLVARGSDRRRRPRPHDVEAQTGAVF
jgi:hypothetical protein